jgi:hypothetical protein
VVCFGNDLGGYRLFQLCQRFRIIDPHQDSAVGDGTKGRGQMAERTARITTCDECGLRIEVRGASPFNISYGTEPKCRKETGLDIERKCPGFKIAIAKLGD